MALNNVFTPSSKSRYTPPTIPARHFRACLLCTFPPEFGTYRGRGRYSWVTKSASSHWDILDWPWPCQCCPGGSVRYLLPIVNCCLPLSWPAIPGTIPAFLILLTKFRLVFHRLLFSSFTMTHSFYVRQFVLWVSFVFAMEAAISLASHRVSARLIGQWLHKAPRSIRP